jgi:predicted GNAT superfamily acetyltransferase
VTGSPIHRLTARDGCSVALRPSADLTRGGPDGIDVYAEEMAYAEARRLQWTVVEVIYDKKNPAFAVGTRLRFGDAGNVTIFGYTDEGP